MQTVLAALFCFICCSFSAGQESTFVCYNDPDCGSNVSHPIYDLSDSLIGCCSKPDVISVSNDDGTCQDCGTPIVAWITPHIVAIYPPSPMVLEINATGYSGVSWLINGTVMHDFARVTLENDNKKFTLSDTSNEDIGHYVAAVHLINGTIVTLDFQVGLYVSPDISITNPVETDIVQGRVNVTCTSQGNPTPTVNMYCDDSLNYTSYDDVVIDGEFDGNLTSVFSTIGVKSRNADGLKKCYCIVSAFNGNGTDSKNKSINLLASSSVAIYLGPNKITVVAPRLLEMSCTGQGRPLPDIIWYRNNIMLSMNSKTSIAETVTEYSKSSILSIVPTNFIDHGNYECFATNVYGNHSQNISVEMHFPPVVTTNRSEYDLNANTYDSVTFTCQAFALPEPQLIWIGAGGVLNNRCVGGTLSINENFGEAALDYTEFYSFGDFSEELGSGANPGFIVRNCIINITRDTDASPFPVTTSTLTIYDLHLMESAKFVCIGDNGIDKLPNISSSTVISLTLDGSPYFIQRPKSIPNLREGDEAMYTCSVISKTPVTFTWYFNGINIQILDLQVIINQSVPDNYVNNSTLTITDIQLVDAGTYTCKAESDNGTSVHNITQNVLATFSILIMSTTQTPDEGSDFNITCVSTGNPIPSISWYFTSNRTGETAMLTQLIDRPNSTLSINTVSVSDEQMIISTLAITGTYRNDAGIYTCRADNLHRNKSSDVTITVLVPATIIDIASVSGIQYLTLGDTNVSITCQATGISAPIVTITHFGLPTHFNVSTPMETVLLPNGLYLSTTQLFYDIVDNSVAVNLLYTCSATNELNTVQSTFGIRTEIDIVIKTDYQALFLTEGETLTLYCNVSAFSTPVISWNDSNGLILDSDTISNVTSASVALPNGKQSTLNTLTITSIKSSNTGPYYCKAVNKYGTVQKLVTYVTVQVPPKVIIAPTDPIYIQGNSTIVTCASTGVPLPLVTFDGINCTSSSVVAEAPEIFQGDNFSGYCESTASDVTVVLVVENITLLGPLEVQCSATSPIGNVSSTTTIYITGPPSIIDPPTNVSVIPGETFTLDCTATGYPIPTIQWSYSSLTNVISNSIANSSHGLFVMQSNLTLTLTSNSEGIYYCIATNQYYSTKVFTSVEISSLGVPPSIITQLQAIDDAYIVGSDVNITCEAIGLPAPTISWLINGALIPGNNVVLNTTGDIPLTTSVLILKNLQVIDEGIYSCVASNEVLTVQKPTPYINIIVPPTVQISPGTNVTHYIPNQVTVLTCTGSGRPSPLVTFGDETCPQDPLSEEMEMSDEGNSSGSSGLVPNIGITTQCNTSEVIDGIYFFTVQHILTSDITDFSQYTLTCRATNTAPTIASTVATISITVIKSVFTSPLPITHNEKETFTLPCRATGYPYPTIDWLYGDNSNAIVNNERRIISKTVLINSYTVESILTITNLIPDDGGEYKCKAQYQNEHIIDSTQLHVQAIDDCMSNPCIFGNCTDLLDEYNCVCFENYTGDNCDIKSITVEKPNVITDPENITETLLLSSFNLTCKAEGTEPVYIWIKDGEVLDNMNDILQVEEAQPDDRGSYRCIASNRAGNSTSEPGLVVIPGIYQYVAVIDLIDPTNDVDVENVTNDIGECLGYDMLPKQNTTIIYSVSACSSETCSTHNGITSFVLTVFQTAQPYGSEGLLEAIQDKLKRLEEECKLGVEVIDLWRFDGCRKETEILHSEYDITITWQESDITDNVEQRCPCGRLTESQYTNGTATRECRGSYTYGGMWRDSNTTACNYNENNVNITLTLCHLTTVTDVMELSEGLLDISKDAESFEELDFSISALILEELANQDEIAVNDDLQNNYVESISNLLLTDKNVVTASSNKHNSAIKILKSINIFQEKIQLTESQITNNGIEMVAKLQKERFAVVIAEVNTETFVNQTFVAEVVNNRNISSVSTKEGFVNELNNKASIVIPQSVISKCPQTERTRISYNIFIGNVLFENTSRNSTTDTTDVVMYASACSGTVIDGLPENEQVIIEIPKPEYLRNGTNSSESTCVFFNLTESHWSKNGCVNISNQDEELVRCKCNHMTHFGYLFDVMPPAEPKTQTALEVITYIGVIVSVICLIITIVTYIGSPSTLLKRTQGKTLLNMSFALIGLYITFVIAGHAQAIRSIPRGDILCAFFGALLYYFVLVYFLWTSIEAVDLYFKLVRVFHKGSKYFIIFGSFIAWGVPLIITIISAGAGHQYYTASEFFCRPIGLPFYIGFLVPFGLIYIFNWVLFVRIMVSLIHSKSKQKKIKDSRSIELRKIFFIAVILSINFGIGWAFGLLATSGFPTEIYLMFSYLFSIFVGMQGVLIFLLHCARTKSARDTWTKWFTIVCCCRKPEIKPGAQTTRTPFGTPFATPFGTPGINRKTGGPPSAMRTNAIPLHMQHYIRTNTTTDLKASHDEVFKNPVHEAETYADTLAEEELNTIAIDEEMFKMKKETKKESKTLLKQESSKKILKQKLKQTVEESKEMSKKESKKLLKSKQQSEMKLKDSQELGGSTYSLGEVSLTGSQALEIEFAPSPEESDDDATWLKLEDQFANIETLVNNNFEFEEATKTVLY